MNEKASLDDTSLQKLWSRDLSVQIQAVSKSLGVFHFSISKYICNFPTFHYSLISNSKLNRRLKRWTIPYATKMNGEMAMFFYLSYRFFFSFMFLEDLYEKGDVGEALSLGGYVLVLGLWIWMGEVSGFLGLLWFGKWGWEVALLGF